jgi:N-acyl-D-amino-acid deacylase
MRKAGKGIFEVIPSGTVGSMFGADPSTPQQEMQWMRRFALESGRPVTFTLMQMRTEPNTYLDLLKMQDEAVAAGIPLHGQFNGRPGGVLVGLQSYHPFQARPTYKALSRLPLAECAAQMRRPEVRTAILSEADVPASSSINDQFPLFLQKMLSYMFPLTAPLDYEPEQSKSVAAQADAQGVAPLAYLYDRLVAGDGKTVLIAFANNFVSNDHRVIEQMLRNPNAIPGLADGGAHARLICDASICTYLLTHWARDRHRGPKLPVEMLIKKQSHDTARLYGFHDRGTLEVGKRADLNIIDFDRLSLSAPYMVNDLPAGGARYLQDADGYDFTIVNGVVTRRGGIDTGERPGRLVRSTKADASASRAA